MQGVMAVLNLAEGAELMEFTKDDWWPWGTIEGMRQILAAAPKP